MTQDEFLIGVAELYEQYCKQNGIRETSEWSITVQYKDGQSFVRQTY